jgi:hypothetical protein
MVTKVESIDPSYEHDRYDGSMGTLSWLGLSGRDPTLDKWSLCRLPLWFADNGGEIHAAASSGRLLQQARSGVRDVFAAGLIGAIPAATCSWLSGTLR